MPFKSPSQIEQRPNGQQWRLLRPLIYVGRTDVFVVHEGFVTDLASVPRLLQWLVPRSGRYTSAAILHDALWHELRAQLRHGGPPLPYTPRDADGIFRSAMREAGVSVLRRRIMYWAVRATGTFTFREGPKRLGGALALLAGAFLGAAALIPVAAYLTVFAAAEVLVWVALRVWWRNQPATFDRIVSWPFDRSPRDVNEGSFLTVRAQRDGGAAVHLAVTCDELPRQDLVSAGAAAAGAGTEGTAALPTDKVAATMANRPPGGGPPEPGKAGGNGAAEPPRSVPT